MRLFVVVCGRQRGSPVGAPRNFPFRRHLERAPTLNAFGNEVVEDSLVGKTHHQKLMPILGFLAELFESVVSVHF